MTPSLDPPWNDADLVDYVRVAARLQSLPLDEAQVARVAVHLGRTRSMVESLTAFDLAPHDEIAEIFRPAPFPGSMLESAVEVHGPAAERAPAAGAGAGS